MLLDRYVLKEILPPALIGFLVFTFALLMGSLLEVAQILVLKGATLGETLFLIFNISLSFLPITIPMSLLMGVVAGISRMSAEREVLALRTLAIPSTRLLKPVLVVGFLSLFVNLVVNMYITPRANYSTTKSLYEMAVSKTEREIRGGEFFEGIPQLTLYVGKKGGDLWENIFIESFKKNKERLIFARKGKLIINRKKRKAYFFLENGEIHSYETTNPYIYSRSKFKQAIEHVDPNLIFPEIKIGERPREKTLTAILQELKKGKLSVFRKRALLMEVYTRASLALSALLFVILGLLLAVNTKKGGTGFGFAASIIIVVLYYVAYSGARSFVEQGKIPVALGMMIPDILILLPIFFLFPRLKGTIYPSRIRKAKTSVKMPLRAEKNRSFSGFRLFSVLDTYIFTNLSKVFIVVFSALYLISLLISFFELIDDVFENHRPIVSVIKYLYFFTPQIFYYILPLAILTSLIVTISLFYRRGEITGIKAGGISLFRFSLPLLVFSLLVSIFSFGLQEKVLPVSNRKAEEIKSYIKGRKSMTHYRVTRRWIYTDGKIFHYLHFDDKSNTFYDLTYIITGKGFSLKKIVHARKALWRRGKWILKGVWFRDFEKTRGEFQQADILNFDIGESPSFFVREFKPPDEMNISELKRYIEEMERDGFDTRKLRVELETKVAFPLAAFIMAFLAIPLGLIFGSRGATIGIGISLSLAGVYWTLLGVFKSLGGAFILPPLLAAWSPNIIFFLVGLLLFTFIKT